MEGEGSLHVEVAGPGTVVEPIDSFSWESP
jgi:hypothetical protein